MPNRAREEKEPGEIENESAGGACCDDCGQPFKTAQGLAGHRRLAHSTATRSNLEAQANDLAEREAAAKRREGEAARKAEAARQREADLARRQEEIAAAEAVPQAERIRKIVRDRVGTLPEVTADSILRVRGHDYRIEAGRLIHLYWPSGQRTELEDSQWFRVGGRAYKIADGRLLAVPASTVLASYLGEGE